MDIMTYLAGATPDEWHQTAWHWNWDDDEEPLRWIVRQPTCDRGTALLVYWYSGPRWYAQYATRDEIPDHELANYDLMMEIERAYLAGFYARQEIAFDPADDDGHDWIAEYSDRPMRREIPSLMYAASPGRKSERNPLFEDGYPALVDR